MSWLSQILENVLGIGLFGGIGFFILRLFAAKSLDEEDVERRCVECGYDLRASGARCPECGAINIDRGKYIRALSSDWPISPVAPRKPEAGELPVLLLRTADRGEAELLREQLIARGVPCLGSREDRTLNLGAASRGISYYEVIVYEDDLELAKGYLLRIQGVEEQRTEEMCDRTKRDDTLHRDSIY